MMYMNETLVKVSSLPLLDLPDHGSTLDAGYPDYILKWSSSKPGSVSGLIYVTNTTLPQTVWTIRYISSIFLKGTYSPSRTFGLP